MRCVLAGIELCGQACQAIDDGSKVSGASSRCNVGSTPGSAAAVESALLVFDPASDGRSILRNLSSGNRTWRRQLRRTGAVLNRPSYQLLYIAPGIMRQGSEEYERSKILDGIPYSSSPLPCSL